MSDKKILNKIADSHLDCFGEFNPKDSICKKKCSVCIRCNIEKNRTQELLLSDEIFDLEDTGIQIQ